jgi:hypothetical protein
MPPERELPAMRKQLSFLGVLLVLCCVCPRTVSAESFVLKFDVTVTFTLGPVQEIFGAPISVGDVMHGRMTYDPSLPDLNTIPGFGIFDGTGQTMRLDHGTGLTLPIETYQSFDNAQCLSGVCDGFLGLATRSNFAGFDLVQAVVSLETSASRKGDSLPSIAELVAAYQTGGFRLDAFLPNPPSDDLTHAVAGTVRLVEVQPVPEPGTLILIGVGASGLVIRRLNRRRAVSM